MASLNKFIGIGNLTKDVDIRYLPNGEAVANFSIACNESWKDKNGAKQERTEFINIVMYRKLAEIAGEYLKKGAPVYIEGKLQTRKWQTKEGHDRYSTEIIADQMQMLGYRAQNNDSSDTNNQPKGNNEPQTKTEQSGTNWDDFDDSIPF